MSQQQFFDQERLGRARLQDNKPARAQLQADANALLTSLQALIPSNYLNTPNSNLGIAYRTLSREYARISESINFINDDKEFSATRIEFIQQILAERLFQNGQVVTPSNYNDQSYRKFLLAIKNAYLVGSKKNNIETLVSNLTGLEINLRELFLEAREQNSAYDLTDTHSMIMEIFIDDLASGTSITTIVNQINFLVNLIKPAHTLYDSKLIWTDQYDTNKIHDIIFGDTGGGCIPIYLYKPIDYKVVLATKIMVSGLVTQYQIASIHLTDNLLYLSDGTEVVIEPGENGTIILGSDGRGIFFKNLQVGQYIQLEYLDIPGEFDFYWTPPDLVDSPNSNIQYYKAIYQKPAFQEFVKKAMDSNSRFPLQARSTTTTLCDRWVQDTFQPYYEDLRRNCSESTEKDDTYTITLAAHMWFPRFAWPSIYGSGREVSGDIYGFSMPYSPITDSTSVITVLKDSTQIYGAVQSIDSTAGYISLQNTASYWDASGGGVPAIGQELSFGYHYTDGTNIFDTTTTVIFGVAQWQLPGAPISTGDGSNTLALPSDVQVSVDGTYIPDAVLFLNAVAGFVTLQDTEDFWVGNSPISRIPAVGDVITFNYYQSGLQTYSMLFDDIARDFDSKVVFDGIIGDVDVSRIPIPANSPAQIGYKWRADLLHHASVLNSPDTLVLNGYQKPAERASIANRQDSLNHSNYFFSPEHLYDTDSNIVLDDNYLDKNNPPLLILNDGVPTFQKTFSYQPKLIEEKKLQDIRKNHELLMYSDLLLKETKYGDSDVHISPICDNASLSFEFGYKENLDKLKENSEWILFDVAETDGTTVTILGDAVGIPELRTSTIKLRDNFVLRGTETGSLTTYTYKVSVGDDFQDTFQLPEFVPYRTTDPLTEDIVNFPTLPVYKDPATLAGSDDIVVTLDGIVTTGLISSFDPTTGIIIFISPINNATIEFTYKFKSTSDVKVLSLTKSRVFDWVDVFPDIYTHVYPDAYTHLFPNIHTHDGTHTSVYYDGYETSPSIYCNEYINYMNDYSDGIKHVYYNISTNQLEDHVYSGPVFETYDATEDEISSHESFPNALVRIKNPLSTGNPLDILNNYDFLNEPAIRIRKKTVRELMPEGQYRITEFHEALPV
jgi:hypothetical protein